MKTPYDQSYKLLFSHPEMVRDLLLGFFKEDWISDLDFSSLERINKEYVTEELRERENDIIWKVKWKNQWLYLLIILEFQSSVDKFMAVRMLSYSSLLYLDLIKEDENIAKTGSLPPILPLVLYNGKYSWTASLSVADLIDKSIPEKLKVYQPNLRYWLLDEGRYDLGEEFDESTNLVKPLIQLEQTKEPPDTWKIVKRLIKLVKSSKFDSLRRAYTVYLNRVLKIKEILPNEELNELYEVEQMLADRVDVWIQRGVDKGLEQGVTEGELKMLMRQLERKFGKISENHELYLKNLDSDELLELGVKILEAESINDLIH